MLHRFAPAMLGEPELALLRALVPRDRQALDIGAHLGLYTIVLEAIVGADRLVAFEPVPAKCRALGRLVPSVRVENVALSDSAGTAILTVPRTGGTRGSARATLEEGLIEPTEDADRITVPVARLDDYLEDGTLGDVGFAKIDVEGHESRVLAGGRRLLESCRPRLLIEIEQRYHDEPVDSVFEQIERLGYVVYCRSDDDRGLRTVSAAEVPDLQRSAERAGGRRINNFVCLPSGTEPGDL